jgi:hypothetical protein
MTHDTYWREGLFAATSRKSAFDCPYSNVYQPAERMKWMAGFTLGLQQIRIDRLNGRDPDAVPRPEFGVETGRRGVTAGSKGR